MWFAIIGLENMSRSERIIITTLKRNDKIQIHPLNNFNLMMHDLEKNGVRLREKTLITKPHSQSE